MTDTTDVVEVAAPVMTPDMLAAVQQMVQQTLSGVLAGMQHPQTGGPIVLQATQPIVVPTLEDVLHALVHQGRFASEAVQLLYHTAITNYFASPKADEAEAVA